MTSSIYFWLQNILIMPTLSLLGSPQIFDRLMDGTVETALNLVLILCVATQNAGGQMERASGEYKQSSRSKDLKAGRCSYTFIVPQQKITGALCSNTHSRMPNQSEVAALQLEFKRQQEQLEKLQRQLEHEGSLATEVRALREESSSMNSRIAQLYSQLLHEVTHKKDQALEHQRLESLLLNATTQVSTDSGSECNISQLVVIQSSTFCFLLVVGSTGFAGVQ